MSDTSLSLALALDGVSKPASQEVERLVGVAGILATLPDPDIDPRFIARLEARLLAEPVEDQRPLRLVKTEEPSTAQPETLPTNVVQLGSRRFVVRKALVAAIAAAMLVALPIVASAQSLPGDPLFRIERFRQNVAISHAHGLHKAFVEEKVARKWYGYGIQMTALGYPTHRISAVFAHAVVLQSRAAQIVLELGSPAEIAALRKMIETDVNNLAGAAASMNGGPGGSLIATALANAVNNANKLAGALNMPVLHLKHSLLPNVSIPSSGSGDVVNESGSAQGATDQSATGSGGGTPGAPKAPDQPDPKAQKPYRQACAVVGQQQLGDTLMGASKLVCTAQNATTTK